MNNKVRFDEILHVYTVSQAARPFLFIVTFKDFFSSNDKGNMYLMQKKKKVPDIEPSLQSAPDAVRFV